jgi:hypothetical protein
VSIGPSPADRLGRCYADQEEIPRTGPCLRNVFLAEGSAAGRAGCPGPGQEESARTRTRIPHLFLAAPAGSPGRDRKTNPLQRPARPTRSLPEPGHQRTSERPCLLPIELVAKPPRQSRRPKGAGAAIDPQDVQGAMQRSGEGHLPLTVTCPVDPSRCRADMVRAVAVPGPQHHQQACKRTNAAVSQLGKFSTSSTPPERRHLIQSPRRRGQGSRAEG